MTQHTPGPWKACFPVGNPPFVGNEGTVIIQKVGPLGNTPIAQANARLIAAAPELLAALKDVCEGACWSLSGPQHHIAAVDASKIEHARAAIAKATGQE